EGGLHGSHGAEQPVEECETDAKILVHEPLVIDHPVMDIVKIARPAEPDPHQWHALHPEALDMHSIVKIAKDPEAPGENDAEKLKLICGSNPQKPEEATEGDQQNSSGNDPFEPDIANGNLACGC